MVGEMNETVRRKEECRYNDRLKNFKVDFTKGSDTGGSVYFVSEVSNFFSLKILIFFFRISKTFISSNWIMIIVTGEFNPTFG